MVEKLDLVQVDLVPVSNISVLYLQSLEVGGSNIWQKSRARCHLHSG